MRDEATCEGHNCSSKGSHLPASVWAPVIPAYPALTRLHPLRPLPLSPHSRPQCMHWCLCFTHNIYIITEQNCCTEHSLTESMSTLFAARPGARTILWRASRIRLRRRIRFCRVRGARSSSSRSQAAATRGSC